jgi:hypothetical protein
MRHRTKTVLEGIWFKLGRSTNPKTKRVHYTIRITSKYSLKVPSSEIRAHFDPDRCRGSKWGSTWKYRTRDEAEKLITMAILKFGG